MIKSRAESYMRWLITNRNQDNADGFGHDFAPLTFWTFDPTAKAANIELRSNWTQRTFEEFRATLIAAAAAFPSPITTLTENQKHVTLFIHGFNNNWSQAVHRYDDIATQLFDGPKSMGELISFDWPSRGSLLGYLPDRGEAKNWRRSHECSVHAVRLDGRAADRRNPEP